MLQIIDIKVPTCWQQLSDKQLRFVFKLLQGNYSLPQVKALCLLKWAKMKILRREGSISSETASPRDDAGTSWKSNGNRKLTEICWIWRIMSDVYIAKTSP